MTRAAPRIEPPAVAPAPRPGGPRRAAVQLAAALALLALLACVAPAASAVETIGSYFTIVNTYVYTKGPRDGRRYLVRPRQAFNVVDVMTDDEGTLWFRIVYPAVTAKLSGTGWTPSAPHELVSAQEEPVLVFSRIPAGNNGGFSVLKVPATSLELLNETQSETRFAQLTWQRVRYQTEQPMRVWARGPAGIHRPGKTAAFISRVYGELVTRNVDKDLQTRLLSGVIRIGDTVREVRWALGDPLRNQEETIGDARRNIWQYPELTVTFENEVVKQIN